MTSVVAEMGGGPAGASAPRRGDGAAAAALALAVRGFVALWAASRFPPANDGRYFHVLATRIAAGAGYTWVWPDGVVTYAAHYPIGYPALMGAVYRTVGAHPGAIMALQALFGAAATYAVHQIAATEASRVGAIAAALAIALHPGLVLYTPAIMTEGVTAALLAVAALVTVRAHAAARPALGAAAVLGFVVGIATLIRPQSLLLAPIYGAVSVRRGLRARVAFAAIALASAVAVCLPWTLRNCERMKSCVLSANAGWNLFIGTAPGATGSWVALDTLGVPHECATVWGEAEKDACFERAGVRAIRENPSRFLALVPRKLAATFDYAGAAGWYLHSSNPRAFDERDKAILGVAETVWQRLIVLAALGAIAVASGPFLRVRRAISAISALTLLVRFAWVAHVGLVVAAALLGRRLADRPAVGIAAGTVFATAATHAVFFGAGRYSLVCFPALAALAGTALTRRNPAGDTMLLQGVVDAPH